MHQIKYSSKSKLFFVTLILGAVFFQFQNLYACSCGWEPIEDNFKRSHFVAVGQVTKLEHKSQSSGAVGLKISKIYKGSEYKAKLKDVVTLAMPSFLAGDAGCAYRFSLGATYLVFGTDLSDISDDKVLLTSLCSQNSAEGEKKYTQDIAWLEANSK